jgi:hypothetical protein
MRDLDKSVEQIRAADNANQLFPPQYWYSFDSPLLHKPHDIFQRRIFSRGLNVCCHHLMNFSSAGLNILTGELAGPGEDLNPARSAALGPHLGASKEVTFSDNANQLTRVIDNR